MSVVTNVILTMYGGSCSRPEFINDFVELINKEFFDENQSGFTPFDIGTLDEEVGGSKYLIGCILVAGFNYLDINRLVNSLNNFNWNELCNKHHSSLLSVDLFWLNENDEDGYKQEKIYRAN